MNAEGGIYYPVGCSVKCYTVSVGYHSGWIIMSEFRSLMLGRMIFSLFPPPPWGSNLCLYDFHIERQKFSNCPIHAFNLRSLGTLWQDYQSSNSCSQTDFS